MKTNLLINNISVLGEADGYDVINPVNSETKPQLLSPLLTR